MTGADGFVGRTLVPRLLADGHEVVAGIRPEPGQRPVPWAADVRMVSLELSDDASVEAALPPALDAVIHLAAIASGRDALRNPDEAWRVNVDGTIRLAEALARRNANGRSDPLLLVASTAEVYGPGPAKPRTETDATAPCSPYASSKLAAEKGALDVGERAGLRVTIVRPFPHTGRDQDQRFVVPSFARRLVEAKRSGGTKIPVGDLTPVREFLHVADVADAYARLLRCAQPAHVYNVASGRGVTLADVFRMLVELVGHPADPEADPSLMRPADIPHLVGDADRLRRATGWTPAHTLEETLKEVVDAQAN